MIELNYQLTSDWGTKTSLLVIYDSEHMRWIYIFRISSALANLEFHKNTVIHMSPGSLAGWKVSACRLKTNKESQM
jgi:hypothetical protein